ncbi:hypothetical protein [Xanthomonas cucurbitae]|uniref:Uncharacterized protein n=1 Tax=Xanthomonas cucurbitae TaxID=56453 RepID=A0ABY7YHT5_9XANT|nr:hypothetical protein [Xanthomonas cucurbitae]WDM69600.1 hypothetical protein K6981_10500 [Xanthomonas cucurbitae]WDM73474.1 hypothetical protein K6978_10475 [Xanthomonas cucurbitae]
MRAIVQERTWPRGLSRESFVALGRAPTNTCGADQNLVDVYADAVTHKAGSDPGLARLMRAIVQERTWPRGLSRESFVALGRAPTNTCGADQNLVDVYADAVTHKAGSDLGLVRLMGAIVQERTWPRGLSRESFVALGRAPTNTCGADQNLVDVYDDAVTHKAGSDLGLVRLMGAIVQERTWPRGLSRESFVALGRASTDALSADQNLTSNSRA